MSKIVRMPMPDGKVIEGEEMQFKPESEPWCVYTIEDGHAVRLKLVVTQIIKVPGKDADGNPLYVVRSSNVMAVSPQESYRKGQIQ